MLLSAMCWILFGGIAGWIASILVNVNNWQGVSRNIFVGAIGAVIGGLATYVLVENGLGFNAYSLIVSAISSILFLVILRKFKKI